MPKIDIDAIARETQREVTATQVDYGNRDNLPIVAFTWHVLVEPIRPKEKSAGGIYVPPDAKKAKEIQTTIGIVRDVGPTAFTGKTASGIDLSKFCRDIEGPEDLIGCFVSYQRYTGNVYDLKNGRRLIMITDSEILGVVPDPEEFLFYYD
jgi:co-chaperonin GroES (HSP10)